MTSTIETDRHAKLRKAAILVATLDEPLAQQLLASLPQRDAVAIQELAERLRDVDDDEHRAVVADFQQEYSAPAEPVSESPRSRLDGVELDASLLARLDEADDGVYSNTPKPAKSPWEALSDADITSLVELLEAEQPQTIAVVLAKLEPSRAAELLSHFPPALQAEVLERLEDFDPTDDQAVDVVGLQLAQWIDGQRQRQQRMSAGRDLVQRILQNTPASQRTTLLARLDRRNPKPSAPPNRTAEFRNQLSVPYTPQRQVRQPLSNVATHGVELTTVTSDANTDALSELESLDDEALLRALQNADRQTVLLALAGAGEDLLRRIVRGLPRRSARQFRQQVRAVGPTRLSEMLAAQRELLRCSQSN